jgi:hypothetical protein
LVSLEVRHSAFTERADVVLPVAPVTDRQLVAPDAGGHGQQREIQHRRFTGAQRNDRRAERLKTVSRHRNLVGAGNQIGQQKHAITGSGSLHLVPVGLVAQHNARAAES